MSSELPEPPWSSRRGRRPRREPLTREALTTVALRIVDEDGLDALSMRRLAQELGVQASGLYTYVSGKAELLQLMLERVSAEVEVPDPDPEHWQEQVKDVLRGLYRVLGSHRDLAGAALANIPLSASALTFADRAIALLIAGGLPPKVAALAADLLPQFVTVSAYEGSLFAQRLEREPDYFDRVTAFFSALPPERFPTLMSLTDELMSNEGDERFEFGLDVLIRGLATFVP
ncbi:MAG TPA: TetR/AcrR family transcriptional regulator [Gaiellaceae bacterium]|nr:TetR/AcrR family transcriptional regulator [Gaiellaceae bacterium]